jgi:hypothetical protein
MAENCKKIVLTVIQKLELFEQFQNEELVTEKAKEYGIEAE